MTRKLLTTADPSTPKLQNSYELLKEKEFAAQKYLDFVGVILLVVDIHQKVTLINKIGCKILGYQEEEIIGKNWFDTFLPPDTGPKVKKIFNQAVCNETNWQNYETNVIAKDGKKRLISWHNTLLWDQNKKIYAILASGEDITEKREAEERLADTYEFNQKIISASPLAIVTYRKGGQCISANEAAERILGASLNELLQQNFWHLPNWQNSGMLAAAQKTLKTGEESRLEANFINFARQNLNLECRFSRFMAKNEPHLLFIANNITEQKIAQEEIHLFFNTALDMLAIIGFDGYFKKISPTWSKNLKWSDDELLTKNISEFVYLEDRETTLETIKQLYQGIDVLGLENRFLCKDGTYRWLAWNSVGNIERGLIFATARDISEQKQAEILLKKAKEEAEFASRIDPLTNLYNRRSMLEKIVEELVRYRRSKKQFSLLLGDIDYFKKVNDTYGHDCGDYVLQQISKSLLAIVREQDSVARWGGEEFLLLLPETELQGAKILAEKIRANIEQQIFQYNQNQFPITITFGVSTYSGHEDIDDIIKNADNALYEGKHKGRNCVIADSTITSPAK